MSTFITFPKKLVPWPLLPVLVNGSRNHPDGQARNLEIILRLDSIYNCPLCPLTTLQHLYCLTSEPNHFAQPAEIIYLLRTRPLVSLTIIHWTARPPSPISIHSTLKMPRVLFIAIRSTHDLFGRAFVCFPPLTVVLSSAAPLHAMLHPHCCIFVVAYKLENVDMHDSERGMIVGMAFQRGWDGGNREHTFEGFPLDRTGKWGNPSSTEPRREQLQLCLIEGRWSTSQLIAPSRPFSFPARIQLVSVCSWSGRAAHLASVRGLQQLFDAVHEASWGLVYHTIVDRM